jgi:ubiquinone/menaquinone biosynthesis C-methylase UbiE
LLSNGSTVKRILDIGCGAGFFLQTAESFGIRSYGVDISHSALKQARSNTPNSSLVMAEGEELPFQSNSFDCVVSYGSIEHFDYPEKGIGELSRVIKKGGIARISVPNSRFWPQIFGLFRGTGQIQEESHSLEEWSRMIMANNLTIDSIQKDYGPPIFKNFRIGRLIRRILLKLSCLAPLRLNYQFIFIATKR